MEYIKVLFSDNTVAYQEVYYGSVIRYCYEDGSTMPAQAIVGLGCEVIDATPPTPLWALPDPDPVVEEQPAPTILSKLDFLNRLTDEEIATIYTASKQNSMVEVWIKKFELAQEINLLDTRLQNGLYGLEQAGLLAEGRATEILS